MSRERNLLRSSLFTLCCLFIGMSSFAQEVEVELVEGEVQDAEIVIEKERKIILNKQRKLYEFIKWKPEVVPIVIAPISFAQFDYNVAYELSDFKPQNMDFERTSEVYQHYIKVGFGNLLSPLLDLSLNSKSDPNRAIGLNVKHESFARGPIEGRNSANGDTQVNLLGMLLAEKVKMTSGLNYQFSRDHFYGYAIQENVEASDIRHDANFLSAQASLESRSESSDWNFFLETRYNLYQDNADATENTFHFNTAMNFDQKIFVSASGAFSKNKGAVLAQSRSMFRINPYYRLSMGELDLDVGMSMSFQDDEYQALNANKFAPYLKADFELNSNMSLYAMIDGGYEFNQLYNLANGNRYLNESQPLYNSENKINLEIGTHGLIGENFSYSAGMGFDVVDNLLFVTNDVNDASKFVLNYDSLSSKIFSIKIKGRYQIAEGHAVMLNADFNNYSSKGYEDIYHKPALILALNGDHELATKLNLKWTFQLIQGINGYEATTAQTSELAASTVLDLGLHYQLKERLGLFISGNNLFNQSNTTLMNYEQRGINFKAGASYRF